MWNVISERRPEWQVGLRWVPPAGAGFSCPSPGTADVDALGRVPTHRLHSRARQALVTSTRVSL
jgi:hypothetical protein